MPTKIISKALLGALSASLLAAPAFAGGNCGGGNCAVPVQVMPSYVPEFGPMTIRNQNPMGHLRSVNFQRAPNVSITRLHSMNPTAGLSDAPSGFTNGCHPSSTTYCRQDAGIPVQVELNRPVPIAAPIVSAPVVATPSEPRVVRIGGGYDPSKFTPRVYGDPTFVPGIAHVPTSIVDRDPVRAQQVLDSGRTVPQPVVVPGTGTAPHMGMVTQQAAPQFVQRPVFASTAPSPVFLGAGPQLRAPGLTNTQGLSLAPTRQGPSFGQPGAPLLQQSGPMAGSYGSSVAPDGTYWEKVSGPTAFGDTIATQVICKRKLPTRVVNPIVNVPVPVPVPVPGCETMNVPHAHIGGRHAHNTAGRWIR